jgi:hypothetical protein
LPGWAVDPVLEEVEVVAEGEDLNAESVNR